HRRARPPMMTTSPLSEDDQPMKEPNRRLLSLAGLACLSGLTWACASSGSSTSGSAGAGAVLAAAAGASSGNAKAADVPLPRVFLGDTLPTCQYSQMGEL